MTKNIVIQLFLDSRQYENIKEAADTRNINYRNDSDMIRKLLHDYVEKIAGIVISQVMIEQKTEHLKQDVAKKDAVIEDLRNKCAALEQDHDRLKENISRKAKN